MGKVKFLDSYILCEILNGNMKYKHYLNENFVINDCVLAEFFSVVLRETDEETATVWFDHLRAYSSPCGLDLMIKAMLFRREHAKRKLSFFDAVGYIYACEHTFVFVTGDKEFRDLENVEFVPASSTGASHKSF